MVVVFGFGSSDFESVDFRPRGHGSGPTDSPIFPKQKLKLIHHVSIHHSFILPSFLSHKRMVKLRETMLFVDVVVCLEHDLRVKWSAPS